MKHLGYVAVALSLAFFAPSVIMIWMGLFGKSFSDGQVSSALLLFFLGVVTAIGGVFAIEMSRDWNKETGK